MNCHEAQNALFADRDAPLATGERAALDTHVATCGECQRVRQGLETALSTWRHQAATTPVPDADREWHAVRRRIRGGDAEGMEPGRTRGHRFGWFALPLSAAAAALAVALYVGPFSLRSPEVPAPGAQTARANANGNAADAVASNLVFVDDKSGWLVVWSESNSKQL